MRKEMIALIIIIIVLSFIFLVHSCKKHENEQPVIETVTEIVTMSLPHLNLDSIDFTIKCN